MRRRFICPRDHEWEVSLDDDAFRRVELACPQCGAREFTCLQEDPLTPPSGEDRPGTVFAPSLPGRAVPLPQLPGYDIVEELGQGGMGVVYKAFDRRRQQMVALKTLQGFSPTSLYRFKKEFHTLAEVTHPNLITLFEPIADGTHWFFTMELIEGVSFLRHVRGSVVLSAETLADPEPLTGPAPSNHFAGSATTLAPGPSTEQIIRLRAALRQLAEGVAALHQAAKLHRDIKPGNVLVTPQGRVVLLDFGLATELTSDGPHESSQQHLAGTVPYMSPEQMACRPLSAASDWYSVGVMLYEALTGRLPFEGNLQEVLRAKQEREPSPPSSLAANLPEDLTTLCMRLLRRRPEDRPSGADIRQFLCGTPDSAPTCAFLQSAPNMPFLGRQRQLACLHEAFEATRQGETKTMLIHGPSGMGKSTLVRHFLDTVAAQANLVVLMGRCYERESVPYKALDSLVDTLSGYLRRLSEGEVLALLPRDALLLARVFPVLRRVAALEAAPRRDVELPDPPELRRRAFAALRELLARLGERCQLILYIDDLQWGDLDSGRLLAELVRPPDAPVLLLLASYRREDSAANACITALRQTPAYGDVDVDALGAEETSDLVRALLGAAASAEQVSALAGESGGNPLFVQELVQHLQAGGEPKALPADPRGVTLDQVLWARIERLPAPERRLLEIVAVAGRPLSQTLARQAAELDVDERALLARLRAARLLRRAGDTPTDAIETYHDRVRETVMAHLPSPTLAAHHRCLARVLEEAGQADPEVLGEHFQQAGEPERASVFYARAADEAAEALAFDRAARLYRRSLDLRSGPQEELRRLRIHLAEALANTGRGPESAREYLQAVHGASPTDALDLRRRAAQGLLTCGHYREGLETLRPVLHAVGLNLPHNRGQALATLLLTRMRLRLRGQRLHLRALDEINPKDIRYIDICWAVGVGLFPLDLLSAWIFLTRGLLRALAVGDGLRIARGLALEASFLVSGGGRRRCRRAMQALDTAERLAKDGPYPSVQGLVLLTRGMAAFSEGHWSDACALYERSEEVFREHGVGAVFENNLARLYSLFCRYYRGEIDEIAWRAALLYQEARERGDFLSTMFAGLVKLYGPLAADDLDGVRQGLAEIREHCPEEGVELLHHQIHIWELNLDLYQGDGESAARHLSKPSTALQRTLVQRSRHLRIPWEYKRGCCFLAAAGDSRLRSVTQCIRRLRREKLPWANGLAQLLQAGVAVGRGQNEAAGALLRQAVDTFEAIGMDLYATVCRRRLGECLGGSDGQSLLEQADAWMTARGIRNPQRMANLYTPGAWPGTGEMIALARETLS
jgi:eukaryotic-like serine/threonine-protein kinase